MHRLPVLALVALLSACGQQEPAAPAPEPTPTASPALTPDPAEEAAVARTGELVRSLGGTLKSNLLAAMKEKGPAGAASFCSLEAQGLTAGLNSDTERVGRSSLKLRNPKNAGPDWVTAWLTEQGERPLEGVKGFTRTETREDGTRVARTIKPLGVDGPCLTCHGPAESLPPDVASLLSEKYPDDAATGYALGALRGVMWAEVAYEPTPR